MDRRKNNEPSRVTIYKEEYFMVFMIPLLLTRRYKIPTFVVKNYILLLFMW